MSPARGVKLLSEVTLKQIAEIAGVHRSTVDKVLHKRDGVSKQVRRKVQKIIDEVGYTPNIIGKALALQNKHLIIAVVLFRFDALDEIKAGVEEAYKEYKNFGLEIEYYVTNDFEEEEQLSTIKILRKKKISGMIISPLNSANIRNAIDDMIGSGIPVVTVNSDMSKSKRMCFVGQDMIMAGRVAGELMGEILNGKGKVAIITGSYDLLSLNERQNSFEAVICNKYPGIEIVETIEIHEQKIITLQKILSMIKTVDDLKGIYITCGNVNEIAKAVKMMNKEHDIKIISYDLYPKIVEFVKQGVINFTIGQDLVAQGYKSIKVLFEYLFFEKNPEAMHIKTSIDIRLKENIELNSYI